MAKSEVHFLVDYLAFTIARSDFFSNEADEQYIFERLKGKLFLEGLDYQTRKAFYGYGTTQTACGVSICYGGREDIYIQLSGTGCRAFESLHPDLSWERYIGYLQMTYKTLHVSRLDMACDTFGLLRIAQIQQYTIARRFASKWRTYLCQIGSNENSVVFGAASSDFRCRIYDKTQERREALGGGAEVPEQWVRVEFQLRNEAAASFLRAWFASENLSGTFLGMLRNQLMYWTQFDGHNYDRMKVASWWKKLLGNAGRVKMAYVGGMEYNCETLRDYVVKQAGSSVRAFVELYGPDKLIADVMARPLNDRQRLLLEHQRQAVEAARRELLDSARGESV